MSEWFFAIGMFASMVAGAGWALYVVEKKKTKVLENELKLRGKHGL